MSVIGDFTVPAEAFALAGALSAVPGMTVEADRLASHSRMDVLPFVWARGDERTAILEGFQSDRSVDSVTVVDEMDEELLLRVDWIEEVCRLIDDAVDHHAAILRAEATAGTWSLRVRFAREEMLSEFRSRFGDDGRGVEVQSIARPTRPRQSEFRLTADQREALAVAVRSGYFAIPRATSARELGDRLGISANAASERVRRGCETLIASGLMVGDEQR